MNTKDKLIKYVKLFEDYKPDFELVEYEEDINVLSEYLKVNYNLIMSAEDVGTIWCAYSSSKDVNWYVVGNDTDITIGIRSFFDMAEERLKKRGMLKNLIDRICS